MDSDSPSTVVVVPSSLVTTELSPWLMYWKRIVPLSDLMPVIFCSAIGNEDVCVLKRTVQSSAVIVIVTIVPSLKFGSSEAVGAIIVSVNLYVLWIGPMLIEISTFDPASRNVPGA